MVSEAPLPWAQLSIIMGQLLPSWASYLPCAHVPFCLWEHRWSQEEQTRVSWSWHSQKQPPARKGQELITFLSLSGQSQSVSIEDLLRWQTRRSCIYPHAGLIINTLLLASFPLLPHLLTLSLQINHWPSNPCPRLLHVKNIKHKHILRKNMSNSSEDTETTLSWEEEEGMFIYATHTPVGA